MNTTTIRTISQLATLTTLCTLIVLPALRNVFIPSPGRRVRSGAGVSG